MSEEVLSASIENIFKSDNFIGNDGVEFLWHVGEPLLVGVSYFQHAIDIINKFNTSSLPIQHSIQTNGTLLSPEWCEFIKRNTINVGLSIDGPQWLHDSSRTNWNGRGSFNQAMRGFEYLKNAGISCGALCVVTKKHLAYGKELIDFYIENDFTSVGFNTEEIENAHLCSSLLTEEKKLSDDLIDDFNKFLADLYEAWWPKRHVFEIREFHDLFNAIHAKIKDPNYTRIPDEVTGLAIVTIQKDGQISTYSPEFAGAKSKEFNNFVIGNVFDDKFSDLDQKEEFCKVRAAVDSHILECQNSCFLFSLCGGSHVSNVFFESGGFKKAESSSCILLRKKIFEFLYNKLADISFNEMLNPKSLSVK
jgi:uncharacterized protein